VCLSPEDYVQVVVYERLTRSGVSAPRALAVSKKVRRRYMIRRQERRQEAADLRSG
jgi:hypothetical protein